MANTSSAQKAIRNAAKKKKFNDVVRDKVKTARKTLTKALDADKVDKKEIGGLLDTYYKQIDKASKRSRKVLHKNKAARLKGNMAAAVASKL